MLNDMWHSQGRLCQMSSSLSRFAEEGELNFHTAIRAIIQSRGGADELLIDLLHVARSRVGIRHEVR